MYQCFFTTLAEPPHCAGGPQAAAAHPAGGTQASFRPVGAASCITEAVRAEARDFDFLHGQWLVENRCLAEPLGAASGGLAFDSVHSCRPLPSGGHLEEVTSEGGAAAATLRLFDARHRRWTIYRISPARGTLAAPLQGGFENGVGTFIGEESVRGRQVLVRETWMHDGARPRWEQAISADGGSTWSTQWIRDFIRVDWPQ